MSGYTVTPFGGSRRRKGKKVREAVMSDETEYTETETDSTTTKTEASDTDTSKLGVSSAVTTFYSCGAERPVWRGLAQVWGRG